VQGRLTVIENKRKLNLMVLIISFDAVGDKLFEKLLSRPVFAAFAAQSTVSRAADSVFLSNTYPVHTSVITGVPPCQHGLISNTVPFPSAHPQWLYHAKLIKAKTLWQAAAEQGLKVATVLWPVTGGAKEIRYNVPELLIQPGQNQLIENLREGSKLLQLQLFLKHGKKLHGAKQPDLDNFSAACMADILKHKKPDLALVHLTAFDTLCHHYGETAAFESAIDALDANLGMLLDAAGTDAQVILFSDHAQLDVQKTLLPNEAFAKDLKNGTFIECCGGSAFFHPRKTAPDEIAQIRNRAAVSEGFARFLTAEEMRVSGHSELPFGFCALPGYAYENTDTGHKGQHGYPLDYENYKVFYMARGRGVPRGKTVRGGSLLDIAPLALRLFSTDGYNLQMSGLKPAREDFFEG
jgi:hypothetical protein